jgi:hypothetical protein
MGPWSEEDLNRIPVEDALILLADQRWFDSATEPADTRLYYVNVDNLPDA